jgi:hypothetical protein
MLPVEDRVQSYPGGLGRVCLVEARKKGKRFLTRASVKIRSSAWQTADYFWTSVRAARCGHRLVVIASASRNHGHCDWSQFALRRIQEPEERLDRESRLRRSLERARPI